MHIKETLIRKLIREALVTEDVDVTEDLYKDIMAITRDLGGGDKKIVPLTKMNQLRVMARISRHHYGNELASLYEFFPAATMGNPIGTVDNLDELVSQVKADLKENGVDLDAMDLSNRDPKNPNPVLHVVQTPTEAYWVTFELSTDETEGNKREEALAAYCNKMKAGSAYTQSSPGEDMVIGGVVTEVKTAQKEAPNYQLNASSFTPDSNKGYLFMVNSKTKPTVFVVSSELLFKVATFRLVEPGESLQRSVEVAVQDAVGTLKLSDLIVDTILTGKPVDLPKTFRIGDSPINARIRINFSIGKIK
jgi:hypothetical protein